MGKGIFKVDFLSAWIIFALMTMPSKNDVVRRILGKEVESDLGDYLYLKKRFKKRHEWFKLPSLFFHYYYKILKGLSKNKKEEIIEVNGCKMKIIPQDIGISRELLVFKTHEPITTEIIKQQVKKDMICFDIGCNLGYYALLESKLVGPKGKVIAFEPSPTTFKNFLNNVSLNNFSNIEGHNSAVGDSDSNATFLISNMSNRSKIITETSSSSDDTQITVPLLTLDTFIEKNSQPRIDLIRMDIEGYEYRAFQGMLKTLQKYKPDLLIEIHNTIMSIEDTTQFFDKLIDLGYQIKYAIPREWDLEWVANKKKDAKRFTFAELTELIKHRQSFYGFNLYITHQK